MNVTVVEASKEHIPALVAGMSPLVKTELQRRYPDMTLETIVERAFTMAAEAYVFIVNGDVVCAVGVNSPNVLSDTGLPWLIPHYKNVTKYKYQFLGGGKRWISYLSSKYAVLTNTVLSTNKRALKWLKWLGFSVGPIIVIDGIKFHPYMLERKSDE